MTDWSRAAKCENALLNSFCCSRAGAMRCRSRSRIMPNAHLKDSKVGGLSVSVLTLAHEDARNDFVTQFFAGFGCMVSRK